MTAARAAGARVKTKAKATKAKATKATKAKPAAKPKPKPKPAAKATRKPAPTKAKPKPKAKPKAKPARKARATKSRATQAPAPRRAKPTRSPQLSVVSIVDSRRPIAGLRRLLDSIGVVATAREGELVLGAAQLLLLPVAHDGRGSDDVREILDLIIGRWGGFPEPSGFQAQEFLRNALAAVGDDRVRLAQLAALVPVDASPELRLRVACAFAYAGDRLAMLRAASAAVSSGITATQLLRDPDLAAYVDDPQLLAMLDRYDRSAPVIELDVAPHLASVRGALDGVVRTLRRYGERAVLAPGASVDAIRGVERTRRMQLPNDYRALLTIADGLVLWDHAFFGTADYRTPSPLAQRAHDFFASARDGLAGCVPLAYWGQPSDWLLYDPHGHVRGGDPGYLLVLDATECPLDGLTHALARFDLIARDVLGTN